MSTKVSGYQGMKVNTIFKNISSIELVNAILPVESLLFNESTNAALNINLRSLPYIILHIPELSNSSYGTNQVLDNAFCKLIIKDYHANNANEKGYEIFVPAHLGEKRFFQKPLDSLSKMTIQLTTPKGEIICSEKDILDIDSVKVGKYSTGADANFTVATTEAEQFHIEITTKTYFNNRLIQKNDLLIFKNIEFIANVDLSNQITKLKEYLMLSKGHYILDVGKSAGGKAEGYTNKIYITNSSSLDYNNGTFTPQITYTEAKRANQPEISTGMFINNSLQNTLTFNITTQEYTLDNNDEEKK
jgi:hypothetical protein